MGKIAERVKNIDIVRLIWTICVASLCVVDVVRNVGTGAQWALANALIGVLMCPFILFRFKLKDFLKIPYYLWILIMAIAGPFIFRRIATGTDFDASRIVGIIVFALYGLVAIRMVYHLFFEKSKDIRSIKRIAFVLWFVMMVMCIASFERSLWPLWFFVMIGAFYLAPLKDGELNRVMLSIVDGLILSFFLIQSYAFLHRPFDYYERYRGTYTNSNINAMFYLIVYMAWLVKLSYVKKFGKGKIAYYIVFFFSSAMCSFILFTLSRTAALTAVVLTVFYWIVEELFVYKNKIWAFFKKGILMVIVLAVSFPVVFICVRYLPGLRHHPVWFPTDFYHPSLVHSYTPIDSKSYVDIDEWVNAFIGRTTEKATDMAQGPVVANNEEPDDSNSVDNKEETALVEITPTTINEKVVSYSDGVIPGTDENHPAFTEVKYTGVGRFLGIRKYVFWYIFDNMSLLGHNDNFPIQITSWFNAFHAHNSFLQIAYLNGAVAGVLYFALSCGSGIYAFVLFKKKGRKLPWYYMFTMLCSIAVTLEGLTECTAYVGKMLFLLSFMMLLPLIRGEKEENAELLKENID